MKNKLNLVLFLLLPILIHAQDTLTTNAVKGYYGASISTVSFTGIISGGDTLTSGSFSLDDEETIFSLWHSAEQENDSIKIAVIRQSSAIPGEWKTEKTITTISAAAHSRAPDTLAGIPLNNRLLFIADTTCGYMAGFDITITANKK